ncbi:hypothetical protein RISK_004975 [Rhodopirellula islandica]|uniref:Uncharacterized protein n=1 Tax=Rhodopirellula islandica TaxID=595434 RepID=A0A0J1B856_RHOIS|nr:hypothetical protein RISK_004975 [Rhodopirellula islandica]
MAFGRLLANCRPVPRHSQFVWLAFCVLSKVAHNRRAITETAKIINLHSKMRSSATTIFRADCESFALLV